MGLSGVLAVACAGDGDDGGGEAAPDRPSPAGEAGAGSGAEWRVDGTGGGPIVVEPPDSGTAGSSPGDDEICAEARAVTSLRSVRLAFLYDVSGSMGKLDYPWHDPTLKWEPVLAATQAFFTDPESAGLEASLTFFPAGNDRCEAATYGTPDVPLTALPSPDLSAALDAVTPLTAADWRGGTPTLAAVTGVLAQLAPLAAAEPTATFAVVLVTDGHPQGCDDDSIESVAATVAAAAATIPTYVIGVRNPPLVDAPDTVSNLNAIAEAGGTETAYFIDTGDPAATTRDLLAVAQQIRGEVLPCDLDLPPPPPGRTFDAQRVRVVHGSEAGEVELTYDADCDDGGWHYDDPSAPTRIHLCADACATVQASPASELSVTFACEVVIPVIR